MLEMQNVNKSFGAVQALKDLSLRVPKGAVYGLVGPNGAGKSTAIRHITGIYRPDSGSVTIGGAPVYENPEAKGRLGYIPDEVFYFPMATLGDMAAFYQGMYPKFDRELYTKLTEVFQLPGGKPIRRMSKGMQKQAAFQLVLAARPEVLILDEPVDGLDPIMRRQIMSLVLGEVAQREMTVLISSHNLRELEDLCDHVGIMDHGRMLLERSLADMQGNTHKLQIVGDVPEGLEILHRSQSGRLQTLILRGQAWEISMAAAAAKPAYYDLLPLSLEEIFIYELGGVSDAVKNILL